MCLCVSICMFVFVCMYTTRCATLKTPSNTLLDNGVSCSNFVKKRSLYNVSYRLDNKLSIVSKYD